MAGDLLIRAIIKTKLVIHNTEIVFEQTEYGKLFLKGYPNFHFNISHLRGRIFMESKLRIKIFNEVLGVCKLDNNAEIPNWAKGDFLSITRTSNELSIVCGQENIPEHVKCERGWRYFMLNEQLDFSLVGILSFLSGILARQGISIFAVSTYDTDYILVKEKDLDLAVRVLAQEGIRNSR